MIKAVIKTVIKTVLAFLGPQIVWIIAGTGGGLIAVTVLYNVGFYRGKSEGRFSAFTEINEQIRKSERLISDEAIIARERSRDAAKRVCESEPDPNACSDTRERP